MPIAALFALIMVNLMLAVLFSLQHIPEVMQQVPVIMANVIGIAVIVLLSVDNIRCKSTMNRALGVVYLLSCLVMAILGVTQSAGEFAT